MEMEEEKKRRKRKSSSLSLSWSTESSSSSINNLDDGCLMHIFSFLSPIPDGNTWLVILDYGSVLIALSLILLIHTLESSPALRLLFLLLGRLVPYYKITSLYSVCVSLSDRAIISFLQLFLLDFISYLHCRPGDTILIAAGGKHLASNIQIKKPLCLIGGGELPDETTLLCSRGSDSALEFLSTCKLANLTVKAELGCCLLHRSGRLTIDDCVLQCESNPLDFLSCPIVSTASGHKHRHRDGVSVSRTRIEGGAKAVSTSGDLALQRVRVIYARTNLVFWFDMEHQ